MKFKNAMSFKAHIKNLAAELGLTTQQVQQNVLIEIFLEKLSQSPYRENFIIKGGYLIGQMIGLGNRATMDLDTTIKGFPLSPERLSEIAQEIVAVPTDDSFDLVLDGISEIREIDEYPGFRIKLIAVFEKIKEPLTIDVTTGDVITPSEIEFTFKGIFDGREIPCLSYPTVNVLSEKIETILSRGIASSRPRDYYDVVFISQLRKNDIDWTLLKQALAATMRKRGSTFELIEANQILDEILASDFQRQLWAKYQRQYAFAQKITFDEVIEQIRQVVSKITEVE